MRQARWSPRSWRGCCSFLCSTATRSRRKSTVSRYIRRRMYLETVDLRRLRVAVEQRKLQQPLQERGDQRACRIGAGEGAVGEAGMVDQLQKFLLKNLERICA